ncbi:MAG: hypothetical protein MJK04_03270 [Psychrosphaera sp.]|nr:hypothetical protein [Psychrosphaera sp.]
MVVEWVYLAKGTWSNSLTLFNAINLTILHTDVLIRAMQGAIADLHTDVLIRAMPGAIADLHTDVLIRAMPGAIAEPATI